MVYRNRKGQCVIGKNKKFKKYKADILMLLPPLSQDFRGELRLDLEFGLPNKLSDIDNCIKPIQDFLQVKYKFNDRQIFELFATKKQVGKGEGYFAFKITRILVMDINCE